MKTYKDFLNESSLSRIKQHISEHDSGIITAFRNQEDCGKGDDITRSENLKRNKSLKSSLSKYGVTFVQGAWLENGDTEVKENSFFVVDLKDSGSLKKDLIKLGEKWEQDAIIFIEQGGEKIHLIGTNDCPDAYPGKGKVDMLGSVKYGKGDEIMTKIRGRPFIFK
jgi:uncharacterized protein (DUF927 family)